MTLGVVGSFLSVSYPAAADRFARTGKVLNIALPRIGEGYRIDPYLRAAAGLQSLGPEVAIRELMAVAFRAEQQQHYADSEAVIMLCRMLFEAKTGTVYRRPGLGMPGFLGGTQEADWPNEPLEIVDGIPILIATGYSIKGKAEPASW